MQMNEISPVILGDAQDSNLALIDDQGAKTTYGELRSLAVAMSPMSGSLAFLRAENTRAAVSAYVACIEAGVPLLLLDREIHSEALDLLVNTYKPSLLLNVDAVPGYAPWSENPLGVSAARAPLSVSPHKSLALLLSTSGSTGTPKLVRLSRENLRSNAESIAFGLDIRSNHRPITSLPYSYSYGLSVINSHLLRGATVILTDEAITSPKFWDSVDQLGATSFAGVPSSYKMLRQMRWNPSSHATLRIATQAGGRLQDDDRRYFLDLFDSVGGAFFVMYGQTEATARMTIASPEDLRRDISIAGRPIQNGRFQIIDIDETGSGEVIYFGPNVMLGYAEKSEDLRRGDELAGVLRTGDLGYLQDNLLFLTGRTKRIVKVFGKRVSLDDIERWLHGKAEAVAVQGDDAIVIVAIGKDDLPAEVRHGLATYLGVHPSGVRTSRVEALPLLSSGKVDLTKLQRIVS